MNKIFFISLFFVCAAISGCSRNVMYSHSIEKWNNLQDSVLHDDRSSEKNKVNVVFYRKNNNIDGKTINIFVNKQYLTSLLPGAVNKVELCSGENIFTAYKTDVTERYNTKLNTKIDFNLTGKETLFFMVEQSNSEPDKLTFSKIDKSEIPHENGRVKEQSHTLSRVNTAANCS
ncbi:cell envelope biogenesis protein OmpA [Moellerella wisconsensis]|uniref:cell envelope biogenesis protein OmpA n=1 Tax=Moellerella wisconsensis TaxID=158849 RepID=UPI003076163E